MNKKQMKRIAMLVVLTQMAGLMGITGAPDKTSAAGLSATATYTGTITVDKTPPTPPTFSLLPVSGITNSVDGVVIRVASMGTDNLTGVAGGYYRVNGSPPSTFDANTVQSLVVEGQYTIEAWTVDGAGNQSSIVVLHATVDRTSPTRPTVTVSETNSTKNPVTLTVSGSVDGSSGMDHYEYSLDNGVTWTVGANATITQEGTYDVLGKSVDKAGNQSLITTVIKVQIDKTGPEIVVDETTGKSPSTWAGGSLPRFEMTATDSSSGLDSNNIKYNISSSPSGNSVWNTYTSPVEVAGEGIWYFHALATDKAGNETMQTVGPFNYQEEPSTGPSNVTISNIQEGQVTVNWDLISKSFMDGYSYEVENVNTGEVIPVAHPTNQYTFTGLEGGTDYDFKVYTKNNVGKSSTPVSFRTLASAPADLSVEKIGYAAETAKVRWKDSKGADKYHVIVENSSGDVIVNEETSALGYTLSNLEPGTSYTLRVTSVNASGEGGTSVTSFLSLPAAPTGFNFITIFADKIQLGWNKTTSASKYNLQRGTESVYAGNALIYMDEGLTPGTKYNYSIRAENATGEGEASTLEDVLTLPDKVTGVSVEGTTTTTASIKWNSVDSATSYGVSVDGGTEDLVTGTSINIPSLEPGKTYTVTIRARNASGFGSVEQIEVTTIPAATANVSSADVEDTSATIQWDLVDGATKYEVTVGQSVYEVSGDTMPVVGLTPGTEYTYSVKAGNTSGYGQETTGQFITKPGSISEITLSKETTTSATISWSSQQGATEYVVLVDGQEVDTVSGTTADISGLTPGKKHDIAVIAVNKTGQSAPYSIIFMTPTSPMDKTDVKVTVEVNEAMVEWNKITGADNYIIKDADGNTVFSGNEGPASLTGLQGGTDYTFTIITVNSMGYESSPTEISFTTKPGVPNGVKVTEKTHDSITIETGSDKGTDEYTIVRDGKEIWTGTGTFTDKDLDPATQYEYTIIPKNATGEGTPTKVTAITTANPIDSGGIKITPNVDNVTIEFTPSQGGTKFIIVDKEGNEIWSGTESPAIIGGLDADKGYEWDIIAVGEDGSQSSKTPISFSTVPGSLSDGDISLVSKTQTEITINLEKLKGSKDTEIVIHRAQKEVKRVPIGTSSFKDEALTPSTEYKYEVYLENKAGKSAAPASLTARTDDVPSVPTPIPDATPTPPVAPKPEPKPDPTPEPTPIPDSGNYAFSDISGTYNKQEIQQLYEMGILKGTATGAFEPNRSITRVEFAALIVRALSLEGSGPDMPFSDTPKKAWYYDELWKAYSNGIVDGFSAKKFGPNEIVTREQAARMLANTLFEDLPSQDQSKFSDANDIGDWAADAVKILSDNGVINGYPDGSFKPKNKLTRAESVSLIFNLVKSE